MRCSRRRRQRVQSRLVRTMFYLIFGLLVSAGAAWAQTCPKPAVMPPFTTQPAANGASQLPARVQQIVSRATRGPYGAIAFGDSLVARWPGSLLNTGLGTTTLDAGVGGYGTGDLLWFLDNVSLGPQSPQRILLLIGTDNLNTAPCNVVWGIRVTVAQLHTMFPTAGIVVTSVLPRGTMLLDKASVIGTINQSLSEDRTGYSYLDVHDKVGAACNWTTPCTLYSADNLHPSVAGFQLLTAQLQALLGTGGP